MLMRVAQRGRARVSRSDGACMPFDHARSVEHEDRQTRSAAARAIFRGGQENLDRDFKLESTGFLERLACIPGSLGEAPRAHAIGHAHHSTAACTTIARNAHAIFGAHYSMGADACDAIARAVLKRNFQPICVQESLTGSDSS
jgi:hypothetical protein